MGTDVQFDSRCKSCQAKLPDWNEGKYCSDFCEEQDAEASSEEALQKFIRAYAEWYAPRLDEMIIEAMKKKE